MCQNWLFSHTHWCPWWTNLPHTTKVTVSRQCGRRWRLCPANTIRRIGKLLKLSGVVTKCLFVHCHWMTDGLTLLQSHYVSPTDRIINWTWKSTSPFHCKLSPPEEAEERRLGASVRTSLTARIRVSMLSRVARSKGWDVNQWELWRPLDKKKHIEINTWKIITEIITAHSQSTFHRIEKALHLQLHSVYTVFIVLWKSFRWVWKKKSCKLRLLSKMEALTVYFREFKKCTKWRELSNQ